MLDFMILFQFPFEAMLFRFSAHHSTKLLLSKVTRSLHCGLQWPVITGPLLVLERISSLGSQDSLLISYLQSTVPNSTDIFKLETLGGPQGFVLGPLSILSTLLLWYFTQCLCPKHHLYANNH